MNRDFRTLKRKLERISQHGLGAAELNWQPSAFKFRRLHPLSCQTVKTAIKPVKAFMDVNAAVKVCAVRRR